MVTRQLTREVAQLAPGKLSGEHCVRFGRSRREEEPYSERADSSFWVKSLRRASEPGVQTLVAEVSPRRATSELRSHPLRQRRARLFLSRPVWMLSNFSR